MTIIELIILAVGLSMDAAAVSISNTLYLKKIGIKNILTMAVSFGVFQGLMPLIGYFAAASFEKYIVKYDHWVALILLTLIGGKMLNESLKADNGKEVKLNSLTFRMVAVQAVATSIDALAVGVSLSVLKVNIFYAVSIISITTFICCILAILAAKKFGHLLGKRAGIIGGIILILIGLKIFIDHTFKG
jgi:putative Mn2+ efflux pump MntP